MTNDNEPECEKCGSTMTDTGEVFVCDDRSCGWNMEKYTNADGNIKSCPKCGNPNEMYWCSECENNGEERTCITCGAIAVSDPDYHNACV